MKPLSLLSFTLWQLVQPISAFTPRLSSHCRAVGYRMSTRTCLASTSSTQARRRIAGLREIVDEYDIFLLDMWGVLHDGHTPYTGVLEAVSELRKAGKELVILSNSSKRQDNSVKMLKKLGFDPSHFSQILTSGEVTFQMMSGELTSGGFLPKEKKVCILGSGDGDVAYCESAGWQVVPVEEAALIIARGTFTVNDGTGEIHKRKDPGGYHKALQETLEKAAKRKLPMIVANPDKIRPDFERPPMPGKLGDDYAACFKSQQEEDSLIKRIGKPFQDVYSLALQQSSVDLKRVVMVGDALETDITGGNIAGCHSLWVLKDGIHSLDLPSDQSLEEGASAVLELFNKNSANTYARGKRIEPQMIMDNFVW